MTLIVEDGTGSNPDANTYADVSRLREFAALIGYVNLPVDDVDCEPLLINAMYILEAECWQGSRTHLADPEQPLSHPRTGLYRDGVYKDHDLVAEEIIEAQCSYAVTANESPLYFVAPANATGQVIEKTVHGAVTVRYSDTGGRIVSSRLYDPRAESLIKHFTCNSGQLIGTRI